MAKPIEATPVLRGKYAIRFIKKMKERERNPVLSDVDKELLAIMKENKKIFENVKTTL